MADDVTTLLGYLRQDLATFRGEVNARLDRLVTQDAFSAEQRRVDELVANLTKDLTREREERLAEDNELEMAIAKVADAAAETKKTQETRKVTFRQGIWIAAVTILGGGVVSLIILVIQNAAHLGGGS
jgi:hypothetical protein